VTSAQTIGGFQANSTETFANIDLSTPGWGLNDLKTKYLRFGGPNTINFPRRVTFEFNDSTGANLTGVTLYIRSGANSIVNAVQAGDYSANTQALVLTYSSTGGYRVATSILDTISQIGQVRKYGFIEQTTSYSLNLTSYSQPFFMLTDTALAGIDEATAAAITTAGINWTTKTITPTADLSYDQINARIAYELAQTANSAQADPRSVLGDRLTLATGWSLVVNSGRTISEGTNIKSIFVPTVTNNGTITGVYSSSLGTSKILEISGVTNGSSLYIGNNATGVTKLFQANTNTGTYRAYFEPGTTPAQLVARELFGFQRYSEVITLADGLNVISLVDIEDVGIAEPDLATVQAYTEIDTGSRFYDRTAAFRLTEQGIKLGQIATRSGFAIELSAGFSVLVKQDAANVYAVDSGLITIKATSFEGDAKYNTIIAVPPATVEADTNEVITIAVEDANGDSSVDILGGDGTFELWKVTTATATNDYETGTLLATVSNGRYRFIGLAGFDIVGVDVNSNIRRRSSMAKGIYQQAFYVGEQIQLAQAPEVTQINTKVDILSVELASMRGASFDTSTDSLAEIRDAIDALPQAGEVFDANIVQVNSIEVDGVGSDADPWGPV
jgi:hypothetical protein